MPTTTSTTNPTTDVDHDKRPCFSCGVASTTRCGQCKAIHFCNKDCQVKGWKAHKHFCKAIATPTLAAPAPAVAAAAAAASSRKSCLIIDGLGPCSPGWEDVKGAKRELLKAGVSVAVVDADKGSDFATQLASLLQSSNNSLSSNKFCPSSILIFGWGSGNVPEDWNENDAFQQALTDWCNAGGNFLVQGERLGLCGNWPTWFGKHWEDGDYFRTDHKCFATDDADGAAATTPTHWCEWYKETYGTSRPNYNVKACMLKNVDPEDALYATTDEASSHSLVPHMRGRSIGAGFTAIACGQCGEGTVSFFGDVNHEQSTLEIMAILARGS